MRILAGWRAGVLASAVALVAGSLACSFSYSSESLSDSSESSSDSSSSSSPGANESRYGEDVESYTQAYVVSGGTQDTFFSGVSDLARKRGISDWESNEETWRGIGKGLGRTKIDQVQLAVYEKNWASDDPAKVKLIRKGFDEAR